MDVIQLLFGFTTDQLVFGYNTVWAVYCYAVTILFWVGLKSSEKSVDAKVLMLGIMWVAASSALHRTYWAIWRWCRSAYGTESVQAQWFVDNGDFMLFTIVGVVIGYTFHMRSFLKLYLPNRWGVASGVFSATLFMVAAHSVPV